MAYSSITTYMGLRNITSQDENWLADSRYNNQVIDVVAKHLQVQSTDGSSLNIRYVLTNGSLVNAISATSSGTVLTLNVGRAGDTVKVGGYQASRYLGSIDTTTTTISLKAGDMCKDTSNANKVSIYDGANWLALN